LCLLIAGADLSAIQIVLTDLAFKLKSGHVAEAEIALQELTCSLDHLRNTSQNEWPEVCAIIREHDFIDIMKLDPLSCRAITKPRGYDGDAVLLDMIYGVATPPVTDAMGVLINHWSFNFPLATSTRARGGMMARIIENAIREGENPIIATIGAGHFRELTFGDPQVLKHATYIGVDSDLVTLEVADAYCAAQGFFFSPVHININDVIRHSAKRVMAAANGRQIDVVMAAGLYDYLNPRISAMLTKSLFKALAPGGTLVIVNIVKDAPSLGVVEALSNWWMFDRDERELRDVAASLPVEDVASVEIAHIPSKPVCHIALIIKKC
jgi:extracellular factor (EF) 3-hydroxypalmitic acid methyl ester biosynthesis protein